MPWGVTECQANENNGDDRESNAEHQSGCVADGFFCWEQRSRDDISRKEQDEGESQYGP